LIYLLPRLGTPQTSYPKTSSIPFKHIIKGGITKDYDHFTFLNEVNQLSLVGWDNPSQSKLWRYNLHYFDYLNQLDIENEEVELQNNIISKWIRENPYGKGTGWEPYPTSLRIINWIKWHFKTNGLSDEAKLSLWNQVQWLARRPEYHLLGNHLFINTKALLFACVMFGLDERSSIYRKALKILKKELSEQFLNDGAHFELSPMYHALAMEDLLDLYQLKSSLLSNFPSQEIQEKFHRGMNWLHHMSYSSGELAHFNDCANDIAPTLSELKELGPKVGLNWALNSDIEFNFLKDSGFVIFRDENIHFIADVGKIGPDYLPGHAHADSLSFELSIKGQRVIVNSGTSEYGLSSERLRQRSTSSHSTVQLDGTNSSDVWSGFRVGKRAKVRQILINSETQNFVEISGSHDGYFGLKSRPIHTRIWKIEKNSIDVRDKITGFNNVTQSRFFIHPNVKVVISENVVLLKLNDQNLCRLIFEIVPCIEESTYHDHFGASKVNKCIVLNGLTPFYTKTTIQF
jgi:uncharacterized heparinase superfamily protein